MIGQLDLEETMAKRENANDVALVWKHFLRVSHPGAPSIGNLVDAVCILVQAFGRNMFSDSELVPVLKEALSRYKDELEVLRYLQRLGFDPGLPNLRLAALAMRLCDQLKIPIIAQWEVVYAIFQLDAQWYLDHTSLIDTVWADSRYFSTYHVKAASKKFMVKRGLHGRPLELAHPAMLARVIPILWKLGLDPIVIGIDPATIHSHELWVWDEHSVQPWTRTFELWNKREKPGRVALMLTHLFGPAANLLPKISPALPGNYIAFRPPKPQLS